MREKPFLLSAFIAVVLMIAGGAAADAQVLITTQGARQDYMSAGGGVLFDYSARNGTEGTWRGVDFYEGIRNRSLGIFGFFDTRFFEVDLALAFGSLTRVSKAGDFSSTDSFGGLTQLGIGVLGKYPINIYGFDVFPLVGINYNWALSFNPEENYENFGGNDLRARQFSQFGLQIGAGFDLPLTVNLFLRTSALLQFRRSMSIFRGFHHEYIQDHEFNYEMSNDSRSIGLGPRFKVGLGYRF